MSKLNESYTSMAVTLLNVLLILGVMELAVRLFNEPITPIDINAQTLVTDANQEPFFQTAPFSSFTWIPHARFGRQTVNSQGFVSTREIPFAKQDGELRVVTLGGSSTVGNGNTDETTYPRLLEQKLQAAFPGRVVNVINAAAGGYSTIESLGYLQTRMVHYRPDVIVVMHGWNDMYYFTRSDERLSQWRENFNLQAMWNPTADVVMKDPLPADVQYLSWSQLYLHLREFIRAAAFSSEENPQQTIERRFEHARVNEQGQVVVDHHAINPSAYALYESNMGQIRSLCEGRGMTCLSVLQPTLVAAASDRKHPRIVQAANTALLYHGFGFDEHVKAFNRLYEINQGVFDAGSLVDARTISGQLDHFFDHIHLSPVGNEALAEKVANAIRARIKEK